MAYCDKCGAYIPDNHTKCLACGYDEAAAAKAAEAAASSAVAAKSTAEGGKYYSFSNDELKARLEEQRRKQREQSRIWAEQEHQRRQREQQSRESAQYHQGTQFSSDDDYVVGANRGVGAGESKLFAALSYFSVLSLIPLLFRRDDDYAMYHARQGLALLIYGVVADLLAALPVIGWVFSLFRVFCIFKGVGNAISGIRAPLPYIGKYGERFK